MNTSFLPLLLAAQKLLKYVLYYFLMYQVLVHVLIHHYEKPELHSNILHIR